LKYQNGPTLGFNNCYICAMDFEEYLKSKKIDSKAFKNADQSKWDELNRLFLQMHPKSFTAQKLYLINPIRRKFPLPLEGKEEKSTKKPKMKPKVNPRPVSKGSHEGSSKPKVKSAKPKIKVKPKPIIKKPKIK